MILRSVQTLASQFFERSLNTNNEDCSLWLLIRSSHCRLTIGCEGNHVTRLRHFDTATTWSRVSSHDAFSEGLELPTSDSKTSQSRMLMSVGSVWASGVWVLSVSVITSVIDSVRFVTPW